MMIKECTSVRRNSWCHERLKLVNKK